MVTACLSMMFYLLLLLIRIAMKLRLSIPLVYLVLMNRCQSPQSLLSAFAALLFAFSR